MNIALIAHDSKKSSLIDFVCVRREFFSRLDVNLMATKNTAELLNQCGIHINQVCLSCPLGGDIEIAAKVCREGGPRDIFPGFFELSPTKRILMHS